MEGATVMRSPQAATGLARRGRRLSDTETEQRMLRAAADMVNRSGLTVSLDHISFEDVIRDADVSRSAVYRRWPYKDLFFSDLVKELAKNATPPILDDETDLIRRVVSERLDWLETPEGRQSLVIELIRQLSLFDFQALYGSAQWRTYLALHATFLSIADGQLRDEVQAILADSERAHSAQVAAAWEHLAGLFGYRLRSQLGVTFETLATLLGATMRGLVIMALSLPDIAAHRAGARPSGAAGHDDWSLPAIGFVSIASALLEPDPAVRWDPERLASLREALTGGVLRRAPVSSGSGGRSGPGSREDPALSRHPRQPGHPGSLPIRSPASQRHGPPR
jgi:AcrR family transcriptional regulator